MKPHLNEQLINATETNLHEICEHIPVEVAKDACLANVKSYIDYARYLLTHSEEEFCQVTGACQTKNEILMSHLREKMAPKMPSNVMVGDSVCEACKSTVDALKTKLKDGAVVDRLKNRLRSLCELVSNEEYRNKCLRAVDETLEQYINQAIATPDEEICKLAKLC